MRRHLPTVAALACAMSCHSAAHVTTAASPFRTRASLRRSIDSLVTDPMFRNANWGILIVDPTSGDTLYSRNSGKLFMPASNQKLLTGSTAFAQLGAGFRFTTSFFASGPVTNGVLNGDLIVVGRGDPSMSDALMGDAMKPLRAAADSLYALGVREITGSLTKGGNAFPDTTIGEWDWDDLDTPSGAAIDELFFNEGVARVTVFGGERAGDSVRVRTLPARSVPKIVAEVRTVDSPPPTPTGGRGGGRGGARGGAMRAATNILGAQHVVHVTGWVLPHDSVSGTVALRDPASAWLGAFAEALADRGIVLRGGITRTPDAPQPDQAALFTLSSISLGEILPRFLKPSQNQIGEILLRTLGLERAGAGTVDSGRRVIERQLVQWGADTAGYAVRDGSGLSRHDYVTPETVIRILDAMRKRDDFKTFYDALPVAGVDGTIANRMRDTPAQGNVHAKTGTVDRAHPLSGYVTTADGRLLMFAFQVNNYTVPNAQVERVEDWIAAQLAGSRFPTR